MQYHKNLYKKSIMKEWLDENFKDMDPKEFVSIFNSSAILKLLIF